MAMVSLLRTLSVIAGQITVNSGFGASGPNIGQQFTTGPSGLSFQYIDLVCFDNGNYGTFELGIAPGTFTNAHAAYLARVASATATTSSFGGVTDPVLTVDMGSTVTLAGSTTYTLFGSDESSTNYGATVAHFGNGAVASGGIASVGTLQFTTTNPPGTAFSTLPAGFSFAFALRQ